MNDQDITKVRHMSSCAVRRAKNAIIRSLMVEAFPNTPEGECGSQNEWNCLKALKQCSLVELEHAVVEMEAFNKRLNVPKGDDATNEEYAALVEENGGIEPDYSA